MYEKCKKILPKSALGRLYVGVFAVTTAIGLSIACTQIVVGAVINSKA